MTNPKDRKRAVEEYKQREEIGGIYRYVNPTTGWQGAPHASLNLHGLRNRHRFAQSSGACVDIGLRGQWRESNDGRDIQLEILEELKKKVDQSDNDFAEDLEALLEIWQQKA